MSSSRPNAFISLPITNSGVRQNIVKLQNEMIQHSSVLKPYVIDEHLFHITVDVHFISPKDVEKYKLALRELGDEIKKDIVEKGPVHVTIESLNTFFEEDTPKILYACIQPGEALSRINGWKTLQKKIFHEKYGFLSKSNYETWSPHITVAKMIVKDKHIPIGSFEKFKTHNFGVQKMETIELRSISGHTRLETVELDLDW